MSAQLTPWVTWSQLNDLTLDGAADENMYDNCGPECVAMCCWHLTGVSWPADTIHDAVAGQGTLGYTNTDQLQRFLHDYCGIPTALRGGGSSTLLRPVVEAALTAGHPLIVLYYWNTVHLTGGHFCCPIACDAQSVTRANPWGGVRDVQTWAEFERTNQGIAVECLRSRVSVSPPLPPPPPPPSAITTAPAAYMMRVDQHLRAAPDADSTSGVLVPAGTRVVPAKASVWATHWRFVQPPQGTPGWALLSNLLPA